MGCDSFGRPNNHPILHPTQYKKKPKILVTAKEREREREKERERETFHTKKNQEITLKKFFRLIWFIGKIFAKLLSEIMISANIVLVCLIDHKNITIKGQISYFKCHFTYF